MTTGALQGLLYCGNILIPSLFPFMVLSAFVVHSGIADYVGRLLLPASKKILNVNGEVASVILLGMTGGFPVGAKGVATLYNQNKINLKTAQQLTMFLVGAGPGFIVVVVGKSLYNSMEVGVVIWLCQLITQIILGIFACRGLEYTPATKREKTRLSISNSLVYATDSGINSIMAMCGLVVVFSCVFGFLEDLNVIDFLTITLRKLGLPQGISNSVFNVAWEVTGGCNACCDNACPVWLTAFGLGWGGLCVHFQIYSIGNNLNIPKLKFTAYRFVQGVISAVITAVVFNFYKPVIATYTTTIQPATEPAGNSLIGSVALVGMCLIFSLSIAPQKQIKNKPHP